MHKKMFSYIMIIVLLVGLGVLFIYFFKPFPSQQAKAVVETFYSYEQDADFSDSWELFHSQMKGKFDKGSYIQDRAHVFMNHFGVDTFSYTLDGKKKLKTWKMSEDSSPLHDVYRFTVIQTFKGKYGHFELHQPIFATEEDGEWRVLWDYNK